MEVNDNVDKMRNERGFTILIMSIDIRKTLLLANKLFIILETLFYAQPDDVHDISHANHLFTLLHHNS